MCPNTEFFLVRIFPHLDWIWRDTSYLSVFSPNARKYGPKKTPYLDTFHPVLNSAKATQEHDILTKILKGNAICLLIFFTLFLMNVSKQQKMSICRKQADIKPVFKIDLRNSNNNYRPVSILPNVSKIFEKHLFKQMSGFFSCINVLSGIVSVLSTVKLPWRSSNISCNGKISVIKENQSELL